jgi:DNA-binding transcriptional MerR regulator
MAIQYTIGEISKLTGLSTKTIRYYESIRLIHPSKRKENNYRAYSDQDIQKLRLIVEAKNLGVPLDEVKNIVAACFNEGCTHLKDYLKKRIPEYLSQTDQKITALEELRERLTVIQNKLAQKSQEDGGDCTGNNECYKYLRVG